MRAPALFRVAACIAAATIAGCSGPPGMQSGAASAPATTAAKYEVFAVRYGTLPAYKVSGLVVGADTSRRLDIAMMVWLLKGPGGHNVLVDAGFHRADLVARYKPRDFMPASEAIKRAGVSADQVTDVIITHIHWDHLDGIDLFPNARVWLQRDEFNYYLDSTGTAKNRTIDAGDAKLLGAIARAGRLMLVDGDGVEIMPGISVYTGGKHTFASQFAAVQTASGTVVLASDNMYLYENLEKHVPIAQTLDPASNLRTQARMAAMASAPRLLIPGHDPQVFVRFPKPGNGIAAIK